MAAERGSRGRIIVFGILFWYPLAGVTYQFLHYLIGLRRLGYDPYYVEDSGRWVYDPALNDLSPDASRNVEIVAQVLDQHGFGDRWAFRGRYPGGRCYGLTDAQLLQLYRDADAFLNVTGAQEIRDEHLQCRRRIYVESDPFASQVKVATGDEAMIAALSAHDTLFTFGENIGNPDCSVPVERFTWLPTRQPVAGELWRHARPSIGAPYTTITTWHNEGKDLTYRGERYYWTKDREFERVLDLPKCRTVAFELAAGVDDAVRQRLQDHGWRQRDSVALSTSLDGYRDYIQRSRGEFTVARDQYVRPRTGWFSDRSACYLAAGRPVITQDTGFGKFIPTGRGLFGFTTMDDVLAAVDAIEADYDGHCRAAYEIAEEYFGAEKVVGSLMARAGL
ncbi:MAG: hypothetical protein GEU82_18600 [Luteitalea sp.]|nr:hypothetical protein [Luteitalea sp.]